MALGSLLLFLFVYIAHVNGVPVDFTYDNKADGWLKLHEATSRDEAAIRCETENSTLVSPVNSQIRDAVKGYLVRVGKPSLTIMSGVQADFSTGDYESVEGVLLTKMPVTIQTGRDASGDATSSESCVKWITGQDEVEIVKCTEILPFVCYKKRPTVRVVSCGIRTPEYEYDARSESCYMFHREAKTWQKAYATCKKEGGYLAVINNDIEHVVLNELFAKYPESIIEGTISPLFALVGIRKWSVNENWKTVFKGQTLTDAGYNVWKSGEPNNADGIEYCGSIYRLGKYNDVSCDKKYAYICEKTPEILYKNL